MNGSHDPYTIPPTAARGDLPQGESTACLPETGFEPVRSAWDRGILSPLCLPFHHSGRMPNLPAAALRVKPPPAERRRHDGV